MKTVKLKDLVDFSTGYAFKSTDYVEYSNTVNCRMSNIRPDGSFDVEYNIKYLPDEFAEKYKGFILNDGDIIIAMTDMAGDPKILGVPTLVNTKGYSVLMNQRVGKLTLKSKDIHPTYLKYYLMSNYARNYFKSFAGGGVQLNIGQKEILNIDIKLCDIKEQVEICNVLDKINVLIQQNSKQIEKLDQLIKSRFVELFGDPETNPYGWKQTTVGEVCSSIVRGPFGSALKKEFFVEPNETTYKVYEQKHAIQKSATIGTYYITAEKFDELRRFECVAGDILMSCSGTMGELYKLPEGCEKGLINQALCKFTLNKKILPIVFLTYMKQTIGKLETKGSGIQNIAAVSYVKAMPINLAPMEVQEQFAAFVEQTDKSKLAIQQSLDKLELLKKSLMQEYFG